MSENYITKDSVTKKELRIKQRGGKTLADHVPYFVWHNLVSMLLFFLAAWLMGLFDKRTEVISDLFDDYYLPFYGTTLFLMLLFGVIGRVIAYYAIMAPFYKHVLKKTLREFYQLNNDGINKLGLGFIISSFINAFFFTVGALYIIQSSLLGSVTFATLILAYIIMKIVTFLIMKVGRYFFIHMFTGVKL